MTRPFRLATFNLESLDVDTDDAQLLERRIGVLRPLLVSLAADILCLQEVNAQKATGQRQRGFDALRQLLDGTPYAAFAVAASGLDDTDGPSNVHNLVTVSRFPIAEQRSVRHELVPPWRWDPPPSASEDIPPLDITWERPVLYARLMPPDAPPLHVLNLHLRAPRAAHLEGGKQGRGWRSSAAWAEGFFVASQKRAGQALEARLLIEQLFDDDDAAEILVCGDFNCEAHEMPTRLILADAADAGDQAPPGRILTALDQRLAGERRYSMIHGGRRLMLDHILASAPLAGRCTGIDIVNDHLVDGHVAPDLPLDSLHAPLAATFSGAGAR